MEQYGHRLSFTDFHNQQPRLGECVINPRWHHLLPQEGNVANIITKISDPSTGTYINIHDAKFGLVLDMDEHKFLHDIKGLNGNDWNSQWLKWIEDLKKKGITKPTYEELETQLNKMKADKVFAAYIAKGKYAAHSYQQWGGHSLSVQNFIRDWAFEKKGVLLYKIPNKCKLVGRLVMTADNKVGEFVFFLAADLAQAQTMDQVLQAVWKNDPIIGSNYVLGEDLGEAVGMDETVFLLMRFFSMLTTTTTPLYKEQMIYNWENHLNLDSNTNCGALMQTVWIP